MVIAIHLRCNQVITSLNSAFTLSDIKALNRGCVFDALADVVKSRGGLPLRTSLSCPSFDSWRSQILRYIDGAT